MFLLFGVQYATGLVNLVLRQMTLCLNYMLACVFTFLFKWILTQELHNRVRLLPKDTTANNIFPLKLWSCSIN